MRCLLAVLAAVGALLAGCGSAGPGAPTTPATTSAEGTTMPQQPPGAAGFTVTSSAFRDGDPVPAEFACTQKGGRNQPPPLHWSGVPTQARALALVVDDPDAPSGLFTHWVVSDIPTGAGGISGGAPPANAVVSANSQGDAGYLGPCPPPGTGVHHYRFTVYALGGPLRLAPRTPPSQATQTIQQAAIATARLVGTFS